MTEVAVEITRYVDESFPGWVELVLLDAHGTAWTFVEKVPVLSIENLTESSAFPRAGTIACEVVATSGQVAGLVEIDTSRPWGIVATTGTSRFWVRSSQLVSPPSNQRLDASALRFAYLSTDLPIESVAKLIQSGSFGEFGVEEREGLNIGGGQYFRVFDQEREFILCWSENYADPPEARFRYCLYVRQGADDLLERAVEHLSKRGAEVVIE